MRLPSDADMTDAERIDAKCDESFLLRVTGIKKRYGNTQALEDVNLDVSRGEVVGVVGHNGAGKSTLMRVIAGFTQPDSGTVEIADWAGQERYNLAQARRLGVRIAFQELSLCPTLRVFENVVVAHRALAGRGWRRRTQAQIRQQLDRIFPGNRISTHARIASLSLAQRQMLEISQAALASDGEPRLLILDEPTSALASDSADNLYRYLQAAVADGLSCILISHRIGEVLRNVHRVVVMRNGQVVAVRPAAELTEDDVIALMGSASVQTDHVARTMVAAQGQSVVVVSRFSAKGLHDVSIEGRPGEIVGLAGLDGQGQRDLLFELWRSRRRVRRRAVQMEGNIAFVTGDRQTAGVFPLWSVLHNLSISALAHLGQYGLVNPKQERHVARNWVERLAIKGSLETLVPDLSGGTQQKVLVARALAAGAEVVLLDDPFRGVDVGTKRDLYRLLRDEALKGRCFIWFTTENGELQECDRTYVFHQGRVVAELAGEEITEERVIAASFSGS